MPPDIPTDPVTRITRLLVAEDTPRAARAVVDAGVDTLSARDPADLRALFTRLAGAEHQVPAILLIEAQLIEQALDHDRRERLLERLAAMATERGDAELLGAARAEQARDLTRRWMADDAIDLASRVLDDTGESSTRVRALSALGGAHAIRRRSGDVARAEECLRESAALARQLGLRTAEAQSLSWLGYNTLYPEGDDTQAISVLERALRVAVDGSGIASVTRVALSSVLLGAGRLDEAVVHLRAMESEAKARGDSRSLAWAAWAWSRHAAYRNDLLGFLAHLDNVERHRTDWYDAPEGVEFLAEASELAQALGDEHTARRYLERADERAHADGLEHMVAVARAGFEARFGDPHLAAELLEVDPGYPAMLRRNRWLFEILRAVAADRRGATAQARRLAADALDRADIMGLSHLLVVRQPVLASRIITLAVDGGSTAAARLASVRHPQVRVRLFGRFELQVRGIDRTPTGQPATLMKRIALVGGTVPVDRMIEWFWPDEHPDTGRRRLRNLLHRLRTMSGEVVIRDGDLLRIPDASIDLVTVETAIDRLDDWASDAAEAMRDVWSLVTGPLLGDDPYEEWAVEARDQVSLRLAGAADRMAAEAELRSDPAGVVTWSQRGAELDPYDLDRHTRLIEALERSGDRVGRDLAVARAIRVYEELGEVVPDDLVLPTFRHGGSSGR